MIQLTKDLAMTADEHCYIVGKLRQSADKAARLDKPTYHTTAAQAAQSALNRAMRQGVADGSITTLRQFIQKPGLHRVDHISLAHYVIPERGRTSIPPLWASLVRLGVGWYPCPLWALAWILAWILGRFLRGSGGFP